MSDAPAAAPAAAKRKTPAARARLFAFTFWTEHQPILERFRYYGGVREKCPKTGTLHWQCFGYLDNPTTLRALLTYIHENVDSKAHVEIARSLLSANENYCSLGKGTTPPDTSGIPGTEFRLGSRPHQGHWSALEEAGILAKKGHFQEIPFELYIKFHRGFHALNMLHMNPYRGPRIVHWYWGSSGTGKSWTANQKCPNAYWQSADDRWFCGYNGEDEVVIDEYEDKMFSTRMLLRLLDENPFRVQFKGGAFCWQARFIIITSRQHPSHYVPGDRWEELERRLTCVIEHKVKYVMPK